MFRLANEALWFEILLKLKERISNREYYSYFMMNFSYFNLNFL